MDLSIFLFGQDAINKFEKCIIISLKIILKLVKLIFFNNNILVHCTCHLQDELLKHIMMHTEESTKPKETQPMSCYHCKLQFKNTKDLRCHVSSHVKVKRFFQRQKRPNKQKDSALKEMKFVCKICSKTFPKKSLMDRHLRIHSGERPFKVMF